MNHEVMNIFNPQASQQAFDQIKISIASPEKIMSWSYGEIKNPKPSITGRLSRNAMVFSARGFLALSRIMSVCAANISG